LTPLVLVVYYVLAMRQLLNNYAFIDGINLHLTYEYLEWRLDYQKLRTYLEKRHNITTAYYFIGFVEEYSNIYKDLSAYGYSLKFRQISKKKIPPVICSNCHHVIKPGKVDIKCDCDADIVLQVMDDVSNYDKAILISSDGDFDNLVKKLIKLNKLKLVLAPCKEGCSKLLKAAALGRIGFLDDFRSELEKI
jgi:uncharacterized LabA/DUF88 family protein